MAIASATLSGTSSCTACPHAGNTCIWNLPNKSRYSFNIFINIQIKFNINIIPCIWPTVSCLSNLSTPASNRTFGTGTFKNAVDRSLNHPNQCCSVRDKSILQTYFLVEVTLVGVGGGGIFTGSSSWIISSRGIVIPELHSHVDCDNKPISWVANLLVSMLQQYEM